jgi:TPR repeat protein
LSSDIDIGNQASQALRAITISHDDQTRSLKKLAAEGEGWAAASLSMIYAWAALSDQGLVWHERPHESQRSFVDSITWARKAIELDHPRGRTILAWHLWRGYGGERDTTSSIEMLKHAESQGDLLARVMRARFYFEYIREWGLPDTWKDKVHKYATALVSLAESDYYPAVFQVSGSIESYIDKDKKRSYAYDVDTSLMDGFNNRKNGLIGKAKEHGYLLASVLLATSIVQRPVGSDPASRVTESDSEEFLKLLQQAADCGNASAMYNLAYIYNCGIVAAGITKSDDKAVYWMIRLSDIGEDYAAYELSYRYYNGVDGCVKDEGRGLQFLKRAAELGHRKAKMLIDVNQTPLKSEGLFYSFMYY